MGFYEWRSKVREAAAGRCVQICTDAAVVSQADAKHGIDVTLLHCRGISKWSVLEVTSIRDIDKLLNKLFR